MVRELRQRQHGMRIVEVAVGLAIVAAMFSSPQAAYSQSVSPPSIGVSPAALPPAPPRPYDGIQAGLDAYRLAEQQRQANVSQQLYLNDQLRVWNGVPPSGASTMYYGYGAPGYSAYAPATGGPLNAIPPQANLNYAYGYGYTRPFGAVATPWGSLSVFEPWPYVPGNIYGYPYVPQPARQPIGRYEVQTSPTHWESHPVYAPPIMPGQPPVVAPTAAPPPSVAAPAPTDKSTLEPIPPPLPSPPASSPREY